MKNANGETPISLLQVFNAATLDVIATVALSMNIDSINNPENLFNKYITKAISSAVEHAFDPFIQYKPHKWLDLYRFKKAVMYLRKVGREQLMNRIKAMKNNEYLPNDILTTILTTNSILKLSFRF